MQQGRYAMLYAKVVVGLPIDGPFDYIVPADLQEKIKVGSRVKIDFHNQKRLGYVVGLSSKTKIRKLKSIISVIDDVPILDRNILLLTKELASYYCCSWGEAIETALPEQLRRPKPISFKLWSYEREVHSRETDKTEFILLHDLDGLRRWDIYAQHIKTTLEDNRSVIVLLPDTYSVLRAQELIKMRLDSPIAILYRQRRKELEEWIRVRCGDVSIAIGTRSAIFAPFRDVGLIIIDEEQSQSYKQDQLPHYNARDVAWMRANIDRTKVIFGSACPSLETFYLAKQSKIKYILIPRKLSYPQVRIIDMKSLIGFKRQNSVVISKYLEGSIAQTLNSKGRILLFINRRGFATFVFCQHCKTPLKCPRCSVNLIYHFKQRILNCHYCGFKIQPPQICPQCNSGYIKYSGAGTEKTESELSRLFPQSCIARFEQNGSIDIKSIDIIIATQSIIRHPVYNFDLIGVISIDNSLNRIDFRAAEKTFDLLMGLLRLSDKKIVIQTTMPQHYCLQALATQDINKFYDEELNQRAQLDFPPYRHFCLVKLRGKNEIRVRQTSQKIFNKFKRYNRDKTVEIISCNPMQPYRLRGNFYWQILIKTASPLRATKFLKKHLKKFSYSDIIITVDMDPL
ncbi:MAG: primosomal protein N' [Candidatus Omnitrophica bacterium]|nr:primosomal protein N' [Candidatus Omnitrophota bacterium]